MPAHVRNSDLYIDRLREADLISDFPGDELFIDGLHTMQNHFWNNGVNLEIPVVRVMNTAHFLAAYMFSTPCSGDQLEYDALADDSLGRDRKMFKVAIIVLAAMLARTEGFRARQCRNMLLENRDPDFDEGVSLYDRFLRSAEKRFAEENFLIDTHELIRQVNEQQEIISQQKQEISTLKYTITTMKNQQNNQYNITYNAPVYNYKGCTFSESHETTNNYYAQQPESAPKDRQVEDITPVAEHFKHITRKCINEKRVEAVDAEIRAACKGTAEGLWRTLWDNENLGYVSVQSVDATTLYHDIENFYGKLPYSERQFRSARSKRYKEGTSVDFR